MTATRKRILVIYDKGAAAPREIYSSLHELADLVFVIPDTPHTRSMRLMLAEFGTVVQVTGGTPRLEALAPDGIITFSERMLPLAAEIAEDLRLRFHSPETVRLLTDKYAQRQRLADRKADPTRSFLLDDPGQWRAAFDHVGVPAVIKPLRGEGSRNTYQVDAASGGRELVEELFEAERRAGVGLPTLVVEEFLQGRESGPCGDYVSVESVVSNGEVHHAALTGKFPLVPPFRELGQFWPSHLSLGEQREVLDLATAAIHALGIECGLTHTEIKLTARGPRIIEVNGRLGGWISELSGRAAHTDLIATAGRIALGEHVGCTLFESDRTFFQYFNLAPAEGGRLDVVRGVRDLRALPGITRYRQQIRPGTTLEAGVTTYQLDAILGVTDSREDMHAVIDRALSAIEFQFTGPDGGTTQMSGHDLRATTARKAPCPQL